MTIIAGRQVPRNLAIAPDGFGMIEQWLRVGELELHHPFLQTCLFLAKDGFPPVEITEASGGLVRLDGKSKSGLEDVVVIGDVVADSLSFPTDAETYTFDVAADGTALDFDSQSCVASNRWQLLNPGGTVVDDEPCTDDFSRSLDAGMWTLRIYSDDDTFGDYSFQVRGQ